MGRKAWQFESTLAAEKQKAHKLIWHAAYSFRQAGPGKPAIGAKTYDKRLVDMELNPNGVMAQTLPSSPKMCLEMVSLLMITYSLTNLRDEYRDALLGFMGAMYEWELSGYKKKLAAFSDDSLEQEVELSIKNDLLVIFKKYVVDEGRNYDRVKNLVCGRFPDYDLVSDGVGMCECKGGAVSVIIRKNTGLRASFKLTLIMEDDACKVSGRYLESDGRWQRTYI